MGNASQNRGASKANKFDKDENIDRIKILREIIADMFNQTYEDPLTVDDEKEKLRCMNELNHFINFEKILGEALDFAKGFL